ncbi:hypothetical protein OIB37_34930 [Streptomyces sp. NBC_00820]|uniref:hypothetical protein n=1 Tax=Streptomyces sp. NBC_00820 TaxID=2975842 RepID=UPI002ED56308|nr:hypothetical protein OIB37_34930 [Streptomyces sp. NBC_00820]
MQWYERAQEAERDQNWDVAIALVTAHAECVSVDPYRHNNHLWHMDLLARAERLPELAELALTDAHARRRLNRAFRRRGMVPELRSRARKGDRDALYVLVRLLCETDRAQEASQAVQDYGPEDQYAREIVAGLRTPSSAAE